MGLMRGWMWLGLEVDVDVCVGERVEQVRREVKEKKKGSTKNCVSKQGNLCFKLCLRGCVFVCVELL